MKFTHDDYDKMMSRWTMARDAAAGEYEVHEKGKLYLPPLKLESREDYNTRVAMTPFFGATWRTIIALRGMLFRKDPDVTVPDSIMDGLKHIDTNGNGFTNFAQTIALESLIVGRVGILDDFPMVDNRLTVADAGMVSPFMTWYATESILDWAYTLNNGRRVLSFVRLLESDVPGIDLEEGEKIHRLLMLTDSGYIQKVVVNDGHEDTQVGNDIVPRMNNSTMNFIPFQPVGADGTTLDVGVPPLMDLITMNFHHYRQSSAYERGCFISGLPTLFVYGNQEDDRQIYIGGATANSFSDPQARAEYVEVKSSFEALKDNIDRKEQQMAVLGARMLESQKRAVESSESLERRQSGEESVLADIATNISDGLEQALKWWVDWQGQDSTDVSVQLNREFLPFRMTAQEITAMMSAYLQGGMSFNTLFHNFERAGLYDENTTMEDEQERIDNSAPRL